MRYGVIVNDDGVLNLFDKQIPQACAEDDTNFWIGDPVGMDEGGGFFDLV